MADLGGISEEAIPLTSSNDEKSERSVILPLGSRSTPSASGDYSADERRKVRRMKAAARDRNMTRTVSSRTRTQVKEDVEAQEDLPTVLFTSSKLICMAEETVVLLDVMRLNAGGYQTEVLYETQDGSALAGVDYEATKGKLVFRRGEVGKQIRVPLVPNTMGMMRRGLEVQFDVVLLEEELAGAVLDSRLWRTQVQRIEDQAFPTHHYKAVMREPCSEAQSGQVSLKVGLLIEYFKMSADGPPIRRDIAWSLAIGILRNFYFLFQLTVVRYMSDSLVLPTVTKLPESSGDSPDERRLHFFHLGAFFFLAPAAILQILEHARLRPGSGEGASASVAFTFLQKALLQRFLNCDLDTSSAETCDLVFAAAQDAQIVGQGSFRGLASLTERLGHFLMGMFFSFFLPVTFHTYVVSLAHVLVLGILFGVASALRLEQTKRCITDQAQTQCLLDEYIRESIAHHRLICDYDGRSARLQQYERILQKRCSAENRSSRILQTNSCIISWLTWTVVSCYVFFGSAQVVSGALSVGCFLAQLIVLHQMGAAWAGACESLWDLLRMVPSLERVARALDLRADTRDRRDQLHERCRRTREKLLEMDRSELDMCHTRSTSSDHHSGDLPAFALRACCPISVKRLSCRLSPTGSLDARSEVEDLHVQDRTLYIPGPWLLHQGELVALVGNPDEGKETLLRLLGSAALIPRGSILSPEGEGRLFVPSHLSVLHSLQGESTLGFVSGSLYENLTLGVREPGHADGRLERVRRICERLHIPKKVLELLDEKDSSSDPTWWKKQSPIILHLLAIARALIANPDVLCIHKPARWLDERMSKCVLELLRDFVKNRGEPFDEDLGDHAAPGADINSRQRQRPRSCIMTSARTVGLNFVDAIYLVSTSGIREVYEDEVTPEMLG